MNIIPAIDLKSGHCVRLLKGSFDAVTKYTDDPLAVAEKYQAAGSRYLHIVDLDGAKQENPVHLDVIKSICEKTDLSIQVGGGIRSAQQIDALLTMGVSKVIIGSTAVTQPDLTKQWLTDFGVEHIVLALDLRVEEGMPLLHTHGWQQKSQQSLWDLLDDFLSEQLQHILCTDIDRDGTLTGPNFTLYQDCQQRYPELKLQASGGMSSLDDLRRLQSMGLSGAIIGKALYENKFTLPDVFAELTPC